MTDDNALPSATIERIVEWPDTDAAGHYHHSAVIRWVEAAENALHERLGLPDLFGSVPRVHYEADFTARLWFRDRVRITIEIAEVGTSSLRYSFVVHRGDQPAARGSMVCVHADPGHEGAVPWPADVRRALLGVTAA